MTKYPRRITDDDDEDFHQAAQTWALWGAVAGGAFLLLALGGVLWMIRRLLWP